MFNFYIKYQKVIRNRFLILFFLHKRLNIFLIEDKYLEAKHDYNEALKTILIDKAKHPIIGANNKNYIDLIPVVTKSDKFGKWSLDPLFGILKVFIMLKDKAVFPNKFKLEPVSISI